MSACSDRAFNQTWCFGIYKKVKTTIRQVHFSLKFLNYFKNPSQIDKKIIIFLLFKLTPTCNGALKQTRAFIGT